MTRLSSQLGHEIGWTAASSRSQYGPLQPADGGRRAGAESV